jgi:RNA polymerase sigma-70 factor (ECF subfamily)
VYAYLVSRCGSATLAEELTQTVFIEAIRNPGSFDGRADAVPWLCGIARHRLARYHRERVRSERWSTSGAVRPTDADAPDAAWQAGDLRARIRFALDALPALQRSALILRYLDDLSVRDVARHLGRSEAATESLLRRGREGFTRTFGAGDDG